MIDVRRRDVLMLLGGTSTTWPFAAHAQQSTTKHRIALVGASRAVADLARSHADVSGLVASANAERDAALADLAQAQHDVDALTAQLLAAAQTPAEAAGIAAVSAALYVPLASVDVPVVPAVAPVVTLPAVTFLPGDPRANA
jgi:hypothetical protein